MDLINNKRHRTLWALWLTQWQRVCRSGAQIRTKEEGKKSVPWTAERDTHRGRITIERKTDSTESAVGTRVVLKIKPFKTDQIGEHGLAKSFIVDQDISSLSAGHAIIEMLKREQQVLGRLLELPLFPHPETGREIIYDESAHQLKRLLKLSGFPALASGVQCF